jgi:hypothetical protein
MEFIEEQGDSGLVLFRTQLGDPDQNQDIINRLPVIPFPGDIWPTILTSIQGRKSRLISR